MKPRWVDAINEEMVALCKNETWDLVPRPLNKKAIGCKWIYKVKHNVDDFVNRLNARVVAKGYFHDMARFEPMTLIYMGRALDH